MSGAYPWYSQLSSSPKQYSGIMNFNDLGYISGFHKQSHPGKVTLIRLWRKNILKVSSQSGLRNRTWLIVCTHAQEDTINFPSEPDTPDDYPDYPPSFPPRWGNYYSVVIVEISIWWQKCWWRSGMRREVCLTSASTTTAPRTTPHVSQVATLQMLSQRKSQN